MSNVYNIMEHKYKKILRRGRVPLVVSGTVPLGDRVVADQVARVKALMDHIDSVLKEQGQRPTHKLT